MPRSEFRTLRESFPLDPGATVHLLPRRVTRFAQETVTDPAAMI
jgi:sulfate transport system ATP-binding protein